ncbi:P-loop containing nucleoside triphosphate hydrolase protein [Blastocladiella britannica]|nr:P-loop containing nucleoside triphosphate hydrolase protein [Blastocladiella britannica]
MSTVATAITVAALELVSIELNAAQVLVVSPTRERAARIYDVVVDLADELGARCFATLAGLVTTRLLKGPGGNPHIVIGTPERICKLASNLDLSQVKLVVLSDADEVLSGLWSDPVREQLCSLSGARCAAVARAVPPAFIELFAPEPVAVLSDLSSSLTLDRVRQYYVTVDREEWKLDTLLDVYETVPWTQSIVYCNSRRMAERLAQDLRGRDHSVIVMHGDISERQRTKTLRAYHTGSARILISTDQGVYAANLPTASLIINYDMPALADHYLVRNGHASHRFGRPGLVIGFISEREMELLHEVERRFGIQIEELPMNFADLM